MTVLSFLIPIGVLGLIAWIVVGFTRSRGAEAFTLATATAFYARVLFIVGLLMSLSGAGVVIKALIGFINPNYSYYNYSYVTKGAPPGIPNPGSPNNFVDQQRSQDLVLGITLIVVGLLVAVAHFYLARAVAQMAGGSPTWVTRGMIMALTVTTALGAIPAAAIGIYQMLSYFIVGSSQGPQPWGDAVGAAIAFVPAWVYVMTILVRDLRRPPGAPVAPPA
jgi:hypothetical protein